MIMMLTLQEKHAIISDKKTIYHETKRSCCSVSMSSKTFSKAMINSRLQSWRVLTELIIVILSINRPHPFPWSSPEAVESPPLSQLSRVRQQPLWSLSHSCCLQNYQRNWSYTRSDIHAVKGCCLFFAEMLHLANLILLRNLKYSHFYLFVRFCANPRQILKFRG